MRVDRSKTAIERAVDDELRFHFDMTLRELMDSGLSADDARAEAARRFGDVDGTRHRLHGIDRARIARERHVEWWSAFAQDVRYAARGLRQRPGFAATVILTLGLGIGANGAMFGIVDRLLLRAPTYLVAPDRVSRLYFLKTSQGRVVASSGLGYRRYLDMKEMTTSFDVVAPFYERDLAVGSGQATREMHVGVVGADLWDMFDVKPVVGRFFTAAEDAPANPAHVVVLSASLWERVFGGNASAIGSTIDIGSSKYTVIGVVPADFSAFGMHPLVAFIPISAASASLGGDARHPWYGTYSATWLEALARRRAGVDVDVASADLTAAYERSYRKELEENPKKPALSIAKPRALAGPVLYDRGPNEGPAARVATWLVGVAAIVLLIACANVANLLLTRALKRRREIAVRIAMGISRGRLIAQLLTESLMLALLGGVAGVVFSQLGGTVVRRALLGETDIVRGALADSPTLWLAAALALCAGVMSGLAPVLQATRHDVAAALKAGSRDGTVQRSRLRRGLLVVQAALSVILLAGAGLFVRSLVNVGNVRLGYDADRLLWIQPRLRAQTLDSATRVRMLSDLMSRAQAIPGVERASQALTVPFYRTWGFQLFVDGADSIGDISMQGGTSDYFATVGTRILRGRGITARDRLGAPPVAILGESLAKRLWPTDDPLGKCIRIGADTAPCRTVVGVAEDVRRGSLRETEMHFYVPVAQSRPDDGGLFIRTAGSADRRVDAIRRALQPVMPGDSYVNVVPMSEILEPRTRSWRLGATMFAVFGGLALVLAAIGLYGVIAYNVAQRTHELGVRIALGADSANVLGLVIRDGLRVVLPGVVVGCGVALGGGRWIAPLLFDVAPNDPRIFAGVILTLVASSLIATWVPAIRAARVDPSEALRTD
jgi:predicted permease